MDECCLYIIEFSLCIYIEREIHYSWKIWVVIFVRKYISMHNHLSYFNQISMCTGIHLFHRLCYIFLLLYVFLNESEYQFKNNHDSSNCSEYVLLSYKLFSVLENLDTAQFNKIHSFPFFWWYNIKKLIFWILIPSVRVEHVFLNECFTSLEMSYMYARKLIKKSFSFIQNICIYPTWRSIPFATSCISD